MKKLVYISFILFAACFKEDEKLMPIPQNTLSIAPDVNRNQLVHIDLHNLKLYNLDTTANWHLKFSNASNQWQVLLNGLEDVAIYKTSTTEFNEIDSTFNLVGLNWEVDIPSASGIVPAIGDWGDFNFNIPQSFKEVFVLRLRDSVVARFVKLQILNSVEGAYKIRYGALDGSFDNTVLIPKNEDYNFTYLALSQSAEFKEIEPKKSDWTFSYTFIPDSIDFSSSIPYAPTINPYFGIYPAIQINKETTKIYVETSTSFDEVDYFYVKDLTFQTVDQLKNFFVKWDSIAMNAQIHENLTLILKEGNSFYAIKPIDTDGQFPTKFNIDLLVKKL